MLKFLNPHATRILHNLRNTYKTELEKVIFPPIQCSFYSLPQKKKVFFPSHWAAPLFYTLLFLNKQTNKPSSPKNTRQKYQLPSCIVSISNRYFKGTTVSDFPIFNSSEVACAESWKGSAISFCELKHPNENLLPRQACPYTTEGHIRPWSWTKTSGSLKRLIWKLKQLMLNTLKLAQCFKTSFKSLISSALHLLLKSTRYT